MAAIAIEEQSKRKIQVNRQQLLEELRKNLKKHVKNYKEAVEGYKELAMQELEKGVEKAKKRFADNVEHAKLKINSFTEGDVCDYFTVVESYAVTIKAPRNYSKEYEAAIAMVEWDVRDMLELTAAEFNCFVRDEWDWKSDFDRVSTSYMNKMIPK